MLSGAAVSLLVCLLAGLPSPSSADPREPPPTVLLAILARSRAHMLPTYLAFIEQLNYPKERISVYIQTDHNQDNTPAMLSEWSDAARAHYSHVTLNTTSNIAYTPSLGPSTWEEDRYTHLMKIRQNVLEEARARHTDYVFFVDTDNFITNPETLNILIKRKVGIVAPMLKAKHKVSYSNYWADMTPLGYYKSIPRYFTILRQEVRGIHKVPMVHSTLLIDMKYENVDKLGYYPMFEGYEGPLDDIIHFAVCARHVGVDMYVDNEEFYGYLFMQENYNTVEEEVTGFQEYLVDYMLPNITVFPSSGYLTDSRPKPDKLGFDEIYMISLVRRPERRRRMVKLFDELRIDAKIFDAIDGKKMTQEYLDGIGVKQLDGYEDPYLKRPLKFGEIGCFLSHYFIWEEIVEKKYEKVIIFEDDVRFKPNFRSDLEIVMSEISELDEEWDLIYLGRKILNHKREVWVKRASRLVKPHYSYWTVGYIISNSGARKLLAQNPKSKMIAVDEYLPLMFDVHPNREWSVKYHPRDLNAFSAAPLLIEPQFYIGQDGYISDTELSAIIDTDKIGKTKKIEL